MANNLDTTGFNSPLGYNSPSFGIGIQQDSGKSIALQLNGKIIMAGTVVNNLGESVVGLIRFNTNGSIDTSFGSSGFVIGPPLYASPPSTNLGTVNVADVTLDLLGNIYVTGTLYTTIQIIFVIKYSSTGTLDTSFGSPYGYIVIVPSNFGGIYTNCTANSIQIDTTLNKVVVVGNVTINTILPSRIGLSRYDYSILEKPKLFKRCLFD